LFLILFPLSTPLSFTFAGVWAPIVFLLMGSLLVKTLGTGAIKLPLTAYNNQRNLIELSSVVDRTAHLAVEASASVKAIRTAPLVVIEDYISALGLLKQKLIPAYRLAIKDLTSRAQVSSLTCRNHYFHDEALIGAAESAAFNNLGRAVDEYTKMKATYKSL
jgi:hypothetical protein